MSTFSYYLKELQDYSILPSMENDTFKLKRFIKPIKNPSGLFETILSPAFMLVIETVAATIELLQAIWAIFRTIGNLLIFKINDAKTGLTDAVSHFTLSVAVAVWAPFCVALETLASLSTLVSTWIVTKESTDNLRSKNKSWVNLFAQNAAIHQDNSQLPSQTYLSKKNFIKPYPDFGTFFKQIIRPVENALTDSITFLDHALKAIADLILSVSYLVIAQPKHAYQSAQDSTIHLSLATAIAIMTPINAVLNSLAIITRLPSTWYQACTSESTATQQMNTI